MTLPRSIPWITGLLLAPVVLALLFVAIFGWNWLRGPIERKVLEKTGRELVIGGDLELRLGWPYPRLHASTLTFANPGWATEKQMVTADTVDIAIDLPQLLLGQETLDLKLLQNTKNTSPLALRSPIYIRGSFARPEIGIDKGPVAARVIGAIALAMVNPLLVLIPLIDAGPGEDSDCRQLIRDAQALPRKQDEQKPRVIRK